MSKKNKIKIGQRTPLVKNLLVVEGITRAGKFLLANILQGFPKIEPVQYNYLLEQIPFLAKFGLIEKNTAQQLLQCEVDIHAYEMRIGRNLNHRRSDKSSIHNRPDAQEYLNRTNKPDGNLAVAEFNKEKPYSLQIAHELMPNIEIYFDTFPQLKVISIQRSPIELVYSWYKRGHGHRWGSDPKVFQMVLEGVSKPIPWFSAEEKGNYYQLSEVDRIIMAIEKLIKLGKKSYQKLSSKNKKEILFLPYEKILAQPVKTVEKISLFLKLKPGKQMPKILKREKLPNQIKNQEENLLKIKNLASEKYFRKLLKLQLEYEK